MVTNLFRENKELVKILFDRKNIEKLEHLIDLEVKKLKHIERTGFKFKLRKRDVNQLFNEVKQEANSFLGLEGIAEPSLRYSNKYKLENRHAIGYAIASTLVLGGTGGFALTFPENSLQDGLGFQASGILMAFGISFLAGMSILRQMDYSYYDSNLKQLNRIKKNKLDLVSTLAHEYAHHVHHEKLGINYNYKDYSIFSEGHAIGLSMHVARRFAEKHDDSGYIRNIVEAKVRNLRRIYLQACKHESLRPRHSLLNSSPVDQWLDWLISTFKHSAGCSLFSMAELDEGKAIYTEPFRAC